MSRDNLKELVEKIIPNLTSDIRKEKDLSKDMSVGKESIEQFENEIHNSSNLEEKIVEINVPKLSEIEQYTQRNIIYTNLLETYKSSYEERVRFKKNKKNIFFYFTIAIHILFLLIMGILIFNISSSGELQIGDLILLLTAIGTIFSSLLIVPKIIANYLFPLNEENNMNDLIKIMQENDSKIRSKIDL